VRDVSGDDTSGEEGDSSSARVQGAGYGVGMVSEGYELLRLLKEGVFSEVE
jgi:hypothetical protein